MNYYIVTVSIYSLDLNGIENGYVADTYVPVNAPCEDQACRLAAVYYSDDGTAKQNEDLQWQCNYLDRFLTFKATKVLPISHNELCNFLGLTQGPLKGFVVGGW